MLQQTLITFPVLKFLSFYSHWMEQFRSYPSELKKLFDFKNSIMKFIRRSLRNVFNCNNYKGIRLTKRLRVGMSHFREHKFKYNFQDCLNPISNCGLDIESTSQFLLHCRTFNDEWYTLLSTLNKIDCKLLELTKSSLSQTLLWQQITW